MASLNRVEIVGNISSDIDSRHTPSGKHVVSFSVATNYKEEAEYHKVIAWEKLAGIVSEYCHKGKQVMVEGRLKTRSYEKNGVKHYVTEIIAYNVLMLGKKEDAPKVEALDDDVPF